MAIYKGLNSGFFDIFSKTQLDQNSTNFKTQPTFSSKLRNLDAKLIFPAKTKLIYYIRNVKLRENSKN